MKQYHKNPRQITKKQLARLEESLNELGDLSGVVHDLNSDEIIGGNMRSRVFDINECEIRFSQKFDEPLEDGTVALGYVIWRGKWNNYRQVRWTPEQCERANLAANSMGGSWDWSELPNWNADTLAWAGFDAEMLKWEKQNVVGISEFLKSEAPAADAEPQTDRAAELLEKWGVKPGDLWQIGEHRLVCGDCTDAATVERVMGGEKATLFETDPPYGVNYSELRSSQAEMRRTTVDYKDIEADDFTGNELQEFLESVFRVCKQHLEVNAAWYLWHAQLTQGFFAAAAAAADILIHRQIIWVKPSFIFGRGDYHWKHELCFYGWVKGNRPPFYGERNQDTVWNIDAGGGSSGGTHKDHPTQKPVVLYEIPLRNHTKDGEILLDPFCGSGTALVACENLRRRCRAVEISPAYVAVALERMATAFPGIDIRRVE